MTISLTYDNTLSRVQVELSSIVEDDVRIERSTNELYWETVRGAIELPISGGTTAIDDYEFIADHENFYRVVDVSDDSVVEGDSITPVIIDVWMKSIRWPFLNRPVELQDYSDLATEESVSVSRVSGRSFPTTSYDNQVAFQFNLILNVDTFEEFRPLDVMLSLGGVMFFQIPPDACVELPPRSMYVTVLNKSISRPDVMEERRLIDLQLQENAPPYPGIVGAPLTWGTIFNRYAGWGQLISANPSWADLLQNVGDPEDMVVF